MTQSRRTPKSGPKRCLLEEPSQREFALPDPEIYAQEEREMLEDKCPPDTSLAVAFTAAWITGLCSQDNDLEDADIIRIATKNGLSQASEFYKQWNESHAP